MLALVSCLYLQFSVDIYPELYNSMLIVMAVYLVKVGYIAILPKTLVKLYEFCDHDLIFFVFFYAAILVQVVT